MRHLTLILALLLYLCAPAHAADYFIDGTGQRIAYGENAQRIVSLTPNVTEMLFFLGLGSQVVGRSDYCDYPPAATRLPSVGGMVDTSIEQIVALKPDLVVAYQGNSLDLVGQLRQLHIQFVALPEATTLDQISAQMHTLHRIASAPGSPPPTALRQWDRRLHGFPQRKRRRHPRVFYGMPGEVTYSAAPGSFIGDLITRAGGRNVVPPGKQHWPQVGAEFVLAAQPDWLLLSTPCTGHDDLAKSTADLRRTLAADPVWGQLPAVKHSHIVVIDADVLLRPGPRILDALQQLTDALQGGAQ